MTHFRDDRPNRQGPADQIRTLIRKARELVEPLDRATFNRRPDDGGWSAAGCLDHLNATARLYLPVLAEAIDDARARGVLDGRDDGRTLLGRVVAWSQEPPVRFRMKTYDDLQPAPDPGNGLDPRETLEEFEALHEELIVRINESSDLDRKRVKIRSALDTRLRLSLSDWFAFLAAHGRRHLWQAERALNAALAERRSGGEIE
jgi:hypothetical protein